MAQVYSLHSFVMYCVFREDIVCLNSRQCRCLPVMQTNCRRTGGLFRQCLDPEPDYNMSATHQDILCLQHFALVAHLVQLALAICIVSSISKRAGKDLRVGAVLPSE